MKRHTMTDFAGAVRELLGIVAAQMLTTALQVCVSPYIATSVPLAPLTQEKVEESQNNNKIWLAWLF